MSDGTYRFTDLLGKPNEREWFVQPARGGGIEVQALDDTQAPRDSLVLTRDDVRIMRLAPKLPVPDSFNFIRTACALAGQMPYVGLKGNPPTVLVKYDDVAQLLELGYFPKPLTGKLPKVGTAVFFNVRVVWAKDLDSLV